VWADAQGNAFAAGQTPDAGAGLLVEGTLGATWSEVSLPGATSANSTGVGLVPMLEAVVGLGPHEALAAGDLIGAPLAPDGGATGVPPGLVAWHLFPDGGVVPEALPISLGQVSRMVGDAQGNVFALATNGFQGSIPVVLERAAGNWSVVGVWEHADGGRDANGRLPPQVNLHDVGVGPASEVWVVGDDGSSHGLAYTLLDGGLEPVDTLPRGLPPITAACEPEPGVFYLAVESAGATAVMLRVEGGLEGDTWSLEELPANVERINAISSDGAGGLFAAGISGCPTCPGVPLVLQRSP
jgi:hypothetical protein